MSKPLQTFWNGTPLWLVLSLPLLLIPHPITWGIVALLFLANAVTGFILVLAMLFRS